MSFLRHSMLVPLVKDAQSLYFLVPFQFLPFNALFSFSNLTFGTGGKDKDGKAEAGWGYYEVSFSPYDCSLGF